MLIDAPSTPETRLHSLELTHPASRHGKLRLGFKQRDGHTIMTENYFRTPLQVMRAITDDAGCARVYMLSPTGGIVQGDRYEINITVEENAHALVTTLAATKVYRMETDKAVQNIRIEVMPNAVLEFVPDAAILFADAHFEQSIEVVLHAGALLMIQDSIVPGRLAAGEILRFSHFSNRLKVCDPQGLLLFDQQSLTPQIQNLSSMGILEGYRCWASWYLLGDLTRIGLVPEVFCEQQSSILAAHPALLGSATRLYRDGVTVRLLANYWSPLAEALSALWRMVRLDYMHLPAPSLRK